ncbi:MAG: hypothetical protein GEV11_03840 [Streptosporangiales bacterium]|nr:hypothetical protein [Streptosporangiales bacterium]
MDTVSLVSAVVSVVGAVVTVTLGGLFEWRRQHSNREYARRDRVSRYRDPLLQAAARLQGRLGNMVLYFSEPVTSLADASVTSVTQVARGKPRQEEYNLYETLYRFGLYQGWVHILFQEAGFLDLGSRRHNRKLMRLLSAVSGAIAGHDDLGRTGILQGGEQQLIGELMVALEGTDPPRRRCLGYLEFRTRLDNDPEFAQRFQPLIEYGGGLLTDPEGGLRRIAIVHNALIDLIAFLDPHEVWVLGSRDRLPIPGPPLTERSPSA